MERGLSWVVGSSFIGSVQECSRTWIAFTDALDRMSVEA
jgi:hypothetical protein